MYIAQQCVQVTAVKRIKRENDFINKTGLFQLYVVVYLEDLNPSLTPPFFSSSFHPSFVDLSILPQPLSSTINRAIQPTVICAFLSYLYDIACRRF